jgi:AraC-like DNA-binding protein
MGEWLVAVVAALLASGGTATFFLLRQRQERRRFKALAVRLEELEQSAGPSIEISPEDAPMFDVGDDEDPATATTSLSFTAGASLLTVLRSRFTILPFDQAARELAAQIEAIPQDGGDDVGADEWQALAEMALAYVKLHVSENLSVTDLAAALHMSSRTLQRGFKRALNCTPRELLLAVRMTEAKRLLKAGVHRVGEVGYQVGFEDPAHFSRRFKAYFQCTPSDFAQQYRDATRDGRLL